MRNKDRVHIIGVAGKATAAIAKMFKDLGWRVSGSDQGIYPPASDYLIENNIEVQTPYAAGNIKEDLDLVVVGGGALIKKPDNPEVARARELGLRMVSYPQVLQEFVVKENSVVVAGSYGKSTITGAVVSILDQAGKNPAYMIGERPINFADGVRVTGSEWSVIEGDEHPAALGFDDRSKFFYYSPKHLILTSAVHDHVDVFPSLEEYLEPYLELLDTMPDDGLVVYQRGGENLSKLLKRTDFQGRRVEYDLTDFEIPGYSSPLLGTHNRENMAAAIVLACELEIEEKHIRAGISQYRGLKHRLEVIGHCGETIIVRDYAHTPVKVQASLRALKQKWPGHRLVAVFEISSSTMKNRSGLKLLDDQFAEADKLFIPRLQISRDVPADQRLTGQEFAQTVGKRAVYLPKDQKLVESLLQEPPRTVVVFMSSGGLRGIPRKYLEQLGRADER